MMQRITKIATVAAMIANLTACASAGGPAFNNAPHLSASDSGVYVYRTKHTLKGFGASIFVDNKPLGTLYDGGFLFKRLSPGKHVVQVELGDRPFSSHKLNKTIYLTKGQKRYIRTEWESNGKSRMIITEVGPAVIPTSNCSFHEDSASTGKASLKLLNASR